MATKIVDQLIVEINKTLNDKEWVQKCTDNSVNKHLVSLNVLVPKNITHSLTEKDKQKVVDHFRNQGMPGDHSFVRREGEMRVCFSFQKQSPEIRQHTQEGYAAHLPENQK